MSGTRPRLLVDLLSITGQRGGTEVYAREVYTRLPEHLPGWDLVAVANRVGSSAVRSTFPGQVRTLGTVGADRLTWAWGEIALVSRAARSAEADVVWSPANFGPLSARTPQVTTVHDVTYHRPHGGPVGRAISGATARLMEATARASTAVITGSAAARDDIVSYMGIPPEHITVIPHGSADPLHIQDPWSVLVALGIPQDRPIVLSTGNRLPHKNFEGLLAALATIAPERRPYLVLTGGGSDDPLRPHVARLSLQSDVGLHGWVSADELAALYAVADLYVCPSLAEGFGLPVIDAMRRGCLVLAHDIPVLREVGGTATRYADATDPSDFGSALLDALAGAHDPDTLQEAAAWAQRFTWDASASATARLLRSVVERASRR